MITKNKIKLSLLVLIAQLFLYQSVQAIDITSNTTISTDTTYDNVVIKNGATLTLDAILTVTGSMTIESGGVLTHSVVSSSSFNLLVDGTLEIEEGGSINMSGKGISSTGAGGYNYMGGTYGGQGRRTNKSVYGDVYNPLEVGSYGRNTSYRGGGLVRMTVGTLINNGSILSNGVNGAYSRGSGGSVNITVNGNLSGTGIYEAVGGECTNNTVNDGGGGRIAIKYGSVDNLQVLKDNTSATGPGPSGEGTIYLKNNTNGEEALLIKGDFGSFGTTIDIVDISNLEELEVNGARVTIGSMSGTILPEILDLDNSYYLKITDGDLLINGDFEVEGGEIRMLDSLTVNGDLSSSGTILRTSDLDVEGNIDVNLGSLSCPSLEGDGYINLTSTTLNAGTSITNPGLLTVVNSNLTTGILSGNVGLTQQGGTITIGTGTINGDLTKTSGTLNLTSGIINGNLSQTSGTINSTTISVSGNLESGGTINNIETLDVGGDMTISNGGILTHPVVSTPSFNLIVDGILDIQGGGVIDMTGKGVSTLGYGGDNYRGGTYGGQGRRTNKALYGDIYNPLEVGSYGYTTSYRGGGLVRMTVGALINNGSILSNATNGSYGRGSGGSINILVNGNLSGVGIYEVNGGECTNNTVGDGGGGRIAIKYGSVDDLQVLKDNTSAKGPTSAGEGTIYLKNNTNGEEALLIKGDFGSFGTTIDSVDISNLEELEVNGARVTIGSMSGTILPEILDLDNSYYLKITDGDLLINGNFEVEGGEIRMLDSLTVNGDLSSSGTILRTSDLDVEGNIDVNLGSLSCPSLEGDGYINLTSTTLNAGTSITNPGLLTVVNSNLTTGILSGNVGLTQQGGTITVSTGTVNGDLTKTSGTLNLTSGIISGNLSQTSGTINSTTISVSGNLESGGTINNIETLDVGGDMTISNGGILTHPVVSTPSFNLIVDGILDIQGGGVIDMTGKGVSTLGYGGDNYRGGTYGGQGRRTNKALYGDIYNPLEVGSYGYTTSYRGGGLVRMTVGALINNGSILSNATNGSYGRGSGGSINILVNGNLSGVGIYEVNGGECTNNTVGDGGGGRIAIKYGSVDDLQVLKDNTSAKGPTSAGEGTIYLKNNTSGEDYLLIKGDGVSSWKTGMGSGYSDYYFDTIDVSDGAQLYVMNSEEIAATSCIAGGEPVGIIYPNIICDGTTSYRYYDLIVSVKNYQIKDRKYDFSIEGPEGGFLIIGETSGVLSGNGNIFNKIKFTKLGTYKITFNLYDGNEEESKILETVTKNIIVASE